MNNADKPINGIIRSETDGENRFIGVYTDYQDAGLTKREYFAGLAMQGFLANRWSKESVDFQGNPIAIAEFSINCADELLKQLENK